MGLYLRGCTMACCGIASTMAFHTGVPLASCMEMDVPKRVPMHGRAQHSHSSSDPARGVIDRTVV